MKLFILLFSIILFSIIPVSALIHPIVPDQPVLSMVSIEENIAKVGWITTSDGGSPMIDWRFRMINLDNPQAVQIDLTLTAFTGNTFSYGSSGLIAGTNYQAFVSGRNAVGSSTEGIILFTTLGGQVPLIQEVNVTALDQRLISLETRVAQLQLRIITLELAPDPEPIDFTSLENRVSILEQAWISFETAWRNVFG